MTRRRQALEDLDQDIREHLQREIEDNLNRGMAPEEAQRAALLTFGNLTRIKEDTRAVWIPRWAEQIAQDCRYGARMLRRDPGFTAVAVIMLALGIGINAAVFSVADAVLFKGFALVAANDRLVYIDRPENGNGCCLSYPDFEDWRAQAQTFTDMAVVRGAAVVLKELSGFAENGVATEVSSNLFKLLGQKPVLGRDFLPSDELPGAMPVAILDYGFWQSRGKDPGIIGQTIRIDGAPTIVIGVMPKGFAFPQRQDLWMPLAKTRDLENRDARTMWVAVARLAKRATIQAARAEMRTIGERLARAYPGSDEAALPTVHNFQEFFIGPDATMIYSCMWGAAGFVLLIACANLANLLLARSFGRSREISVRIALGAGHGRIIRQLLIESAMISSLGALFGWCVAKWAVRLYAVCEWPAGSRVWRVADYTMDARVLVYLVAISIGTALLFGIAPALRLRRVDVNAALKDGGRSAIGGVRANTLSRLLVTGEMALAIMLLAGAGVMIHSFLNIYTAKLGVTTNHLVATSMALPLSRYPNGEARISFFDRLKARLLAIPGVQSVALADLLPANGALRFPYELADSSGVEDEPVSALIVGPDYFATFGTTLLSGRDFNNFDRTSGVSVAIVNQRFASQHWPGENPIGEHFRIMVGQAPAAWLTVVGVAPDIVQDVERQRIDPLIYLPYCQNPAGGMKVIVESRIPPARLATSLRSEIQALDSDLPITSPMTLDQILAWNYWDSGFYGVLFLVFAAAGLLLASLGLYAVVERAVSRRTREIAIRMTLGADRGDIVRLVLRHGLVPAGIGLAIGLPASLAVTQILKTILVHVSPVDPVTYLVICGVLVIAAAMGCWVPVQRAMCVDPALAVRHE